MTAPFLPVLAPGDGDAAATLAAAALASSPHLLALLDGSGRVLALNPRAETLAGAPAATLIGRPLWACPPFAGSPAEALVRDGFERALGTAAFERDIELVPAGAATGPDGSAGAAPRAVTLRLSIGRVTATNGAPATLLVRGRDITLEGLSQQMLDDLCRERDRLEARLRTPAVADATAAPAPARRARVLIAEDNPEMNRFLSEALSRRFEVDATLDGATALERALACPPDLVLTDLMMPRMNGDALVRQLRTHRALDEVPIVLLTANDDDEIRVRLLREGAQDFLAKPFSAKELLIRVGNLVDVKRTRQILRDEVATQGRDLESLARALAARSHELEGALATTRAARENAERAGAAKDLFLSVASHELRTPITALQLQIDRLRRQRGGESDDVLRRVQRAIDRLIALVDSLIEYSRVQSGAVTVAAQPFDAAAAVAEIVADARVRAEAKGLAVELDVPAAGVNLASDPRLFRMVVANLVDNAVKFTDRGRVVVRLESRGTGVPGGVRVVVEDTGPGVPPDDRQRIFQPFQHGENAEHKHIPGVGLGLAVVREVMTALGGSVQLRSEAGQGSTFIAVFPPAGPHADPDRRLTSAIAPEVA